MNSSLHCINFRQTLSGLTRVQNKTLTQPSKIRRNRPERDGTVRNETELSEMTQNCPKLDGTVRS